VMAELKTGMGEQEVHEVGLYLAWRDSQDQLL
jgi:hypothetical protein